MPDAPQLLAQLPGESTEAYARFLVYRNLGPVRSIDAAYALASAEAPKRAKSRQSAKATKSTARGVGDRASGQWKKDSVAFNWSERAAAWDVEMLETAGQQVVVKFVNALDLVFTKILQSLADERMKPQKWEQIIESVTILGGFIPQEAATEIRQRAQNAVGGTAEPAKPIAATDQPARA